MTYQRLFDCGRMVGLKRLVGHGDQGLPPGIAKAGPLGSGRACRDGTRSQSSYDRIVNESPISA